MLITKLPFNSLLRTLKLVYISFMNLIVFLRKKYEKKVFSKIYSRL